MSVPPRVSIVTLGARDVAAQRAFYEALGWPVAIAAEDGFAAFGTGGAVLALFGLDDLAADAGLPSATVDGFRGVACAVNVETPEAVDAALQAAREAGAEILKEAETADWGGRSGYFADPEDNAWEVAWMPGSSFDERGALILPPAS